MKILVIFLTAAIIRLGFSLLPSFDIDMGTWQAWARMLAHDGSAKFYSSPVWNHYLPGYLYLLWGLGFLEKTFSFSVISPFLIKSVTTIFDFATSIFLYKLIKKHSQKWAISISLIYLLNPAVIFNSNVWGQVDGILSFFLLLTLISLEEWGRPVLSSVIFGLSVLLKPQAIALLPIWLFALYRKSSPKTILKGVFVSFITFLVFSFPFFPRNPLFGPIGLFFKMAEDYSFTSLFAFNFWSVVGAWIPDGKMFLGVSFFLWGIILYLVSLLLIWSFLCKNRANIYFLSAASLLAFFLFPTRVHERYLLPFFAFIFLSAGIKKSVGLLSVAIFFSVVHFFNLYYVYTYYNPNWLKLTFASNFLSQASSFFSILSLVGFFSLLKYESLEQILKNSFSRLKPVKFKKDSTTPIEEPWFVNHKKEILIFVVLFATLTRVIRLAVPNTHMFDEVYHAFTAQEMFKGNKASWEWWNTPPKGYAYEWSHPPLAKELMVVGLKVVGDTPFGWRIPGAILGSLSVLLVFLIAWEIFHSHTISLLSALVFSLDTLPLAISRIGMNDSYFLFFMLLSYWFLLKGRYLLMGISFGLSLASKWTAIYFLGLVAFVWLWQRGWRNLKGTFLLAFSAIVLPLLIYLFSYLPFFTWGHTPEKFIELQHQMWWYHTGLKATHPFQSSWWSWPLMLRPVWLYVDYQKETIANAYAQGNPLFYWIGIIAVVFALYTSLRKGNRELRVIIFAYLVFFLPWAFSPRIMFLYHYLPSTPFLAIIVAWFLTFLLKKDHKKVAIGLLLIIAASFLFFYPNVTAIPVPNEIDKIFFLLPSWK